VDDLPADRLISERGTAPRRAGVLGFPVAHSLSPALHRAAYAALGLTGWSYDAIECESDALAALVSSAPEDVVGYSCTMPLKRTVLAVADDTSPMAAAIGAGNTLTRTGSGWRADNTDWAGIAGALSEAGVSVTGLVVVLGAGGTAQAALAALMPAQEVTVLVRDPGRAAALQSAAERLGRPVRISLLSDIEALDQADLVISTLPAGAADVLAGHRWTDRQAVLDAIYHPWPTVLASAMRAAGATVVSGASMLLHQAARQVELMTGSTAPVEAMRAALRTAAPGCGV
jgi:shikimate dehydrogenase